MSMMSSHLAFPRRGHLKKVIHVFGYIKKHHSSEMVFDRSTPSVYHRYFKREDWYLSIYCQIEEELPYNTHEPRLLVIRMRLYVDHNHSRYSITRKLITGFVVFLNEDPIYWMYKKQTSCETSTFVSEFVAMNQYVEYVRGLRYKVKIFGIPCDDPIFVYGNN